MYCCLLNAISVMSNVFGFLDTTACPATDARQPSVMAPRLLSWIMTVTTSLSWVSCRPALDYFSPKCATLPFFPSLYFFLFSFFSSFLKSVSLCSAREKKICLHPRLRQCIELFQELSCVRILLVANIQMLSLTWAALFCQTEPCLKLIHWC